MSFVLQSITYDITKENTKTGKTDTKSDFFVSKIFAQTHVIIFLEKLRDILIQHIFKCACIKNAIKLQFVLRRGTKMLNKRYNERLLLHTAYLCITKLCINFIPYS